MTINTEKRLQLAADLFGWRPHPTQRLWLLDDHKVKVAACGRRWGKTEAQAVDAATFALCNKRSRQMIISPTYDQSNLIFDTVERLLLSLDSCGEQVRSVRTPYPLIRMCNSVVMARTADEYGRNLRGHTADRVIVDEAAFVRDAVIDEVIAPMLADRNGQLVMISTPFGKNHFYKAFVKGDEHGDDTGRYASFRFPSWENPYISREYIESQREALSLRQFGVEYEATFIDDQNSVFIWADIEAAVRSEACAGSQAASWRTAGVDWARYQDYTAVVVVDTGVSPNAVVAVDRFNQLSWQSQVTRVADFLRAYDVNVAMVDQTSVGDPLIEQLRTEVWNRREMNVDVQGLTFTNTNKREIIDNLVVKLAHRGLTIPNHEQLIRELQYYEYELTPAGNVRMNATSGCTDDLVVALALAAWAAKTAPSFSDGDRFLTSHRRRGVETW